MYNLDHSYTLQKSLSYELKSIRCNSKQMNIRNKGMDTKYTFHLSHNILQYMDMCLLLMFY